MQGQSKCKCLNRPKFFCQTHKIFICHLEVPEHNCPFIPFELFLQKTTEYDTDYILAFNGLQSRARTFMKQTTNQIDQKVNSLKDESLFVFKNLSKIVSVYEDMIRKHCNKAIDDHLDEASEEFDHLRSSNGLINLESSFTQRSVAKINQQSSELEMKITRLVENEKVHEIIKQYVKSLAYQAEMFESSLLAYRTASLWQQDWLSQQLASRVGQVSLRENVKFVEPYLEPVVSTYQKTLVNKFEDKSNRFIPIQVNSNAKTKKPISRSKISFGTYDPVLIDTVIDWNPSPLEFLSTNKMSEILGPINIDSKLSTKISRALLTDVASDCQYRGNTISEFGENDFEVDEEINLAESSEFKAESLRENFTNTLQMLCQLLDHALLDFNCQGFFDIKFRQKVNAYLDGFLAAIKDIVLNLKNYFNKM